MKVLLADDDPVSRLLLLPLLDKWGCDVQVAQDGSSAWAALQARGCPRLALMDWMMPGLSGPEVCAKLRSRRSEPYIYVILLTARNDQQDVIAGLESGADDYLTKPCNPAELRARIQIGERIIQMQDDLIRARDLVRFKSTHDSLTGAWSRDDSLNMLDRELSRAACEKRPLGVVLADFDHFKEINNAMGHLVGDEVIRAAALRILSLVRMYDTVGRLGGDEFLILLPGCDASIIHERAGRILHLLGHSPIETSSGAVSLTASLGALSAAPNQSPTSESVLRAANAALSRAKHNGRNNVQVLTLDISSSVSPVVERPFVMEVI